MTFALQFLIFDLIYFSFISYAQIQTQINNENLTLFYPKAVSKFITQQITYDMVQMKNSSIIFVISRNGYLQIVDFKDLNNPILIKEMFIAPALNDLALSDDEKYLYLSCVSDGLKVLDVSNKSNISIISNFSQPKWIVQSQFLFKKEQNQDQFLALAIDGQFAILNVTDIHSPTLYFNTTTGGAQTYYIQVTQDQRFAIISERSQGFVFYDVRDKKKPVYAGRLKFSNMIYYFLLHPKQPYMCSYIANTGFICIDISPFYKLQYPLTMSNITSYDVMQVSSVRRMACTSDGNFIYAGLREQGIQIVDFRQPPKIIPKHFIQLKDQLYFAAVKLSTDQNLLYVVNTEGIAIFQRIQKPNLNKDRPNLHHYYNSQIIPTPWMNAGIGARFSPSIDEKYVFLAQQYGGFNTFNVTDPTNVQPIFIYQQDSTPIIVDYVIQSQKQPQYLYVTCQTKGLRIYDISDQSHPILISTTVGPSTATFNMVIEMKTNPDILILMTFFEGLYVFNVSNKSAPIPMKIFPSMGQMRDILISKEEKILYSTNRDYGVVTWDISDLNNFKAIDFIINSSPEIMKTTKDYKYLMMADGKRGFTIYNSSIPSKLTFVSQLWLGSWSYDITLSKDDNYVMICSWSSQPNVVLIDISDKFHPITIQTFGDYIITSSVILINNDKTLLINSQPLQITVLPLVIPQAILSVFYRVGTNENLDLSNPLLVGQNIEIHISSLDYPFLKKIMEITHQANNEKLKNNLNFTCGNSLQTCYLQLLITKEIEGPNYLEIKSVMKVSELDFIDESYGINSTIATQIVKFLQQSKLLDQNLYPSKDLDIQIDIFYIIEQQMPSFTKYANLIYKVFANRLFIFPSYFIVKSSLKLNISSNDTIIQSTASQMLSIMLKIDFITQAQWFNKNYQGVNLFLSEGDTKLQYTASIDELNQILHKIKIANYVSKENVMIGFQVNDNINYPVYIHTALSNFTFLQMNHPVSLQTSLDEQFKNKVNSNNQIYIEEDFQFQFAINTFQDDDELIYKAQINLGDGFKQIPSYYCVQFLANQRTIVFSPKSQNFRQTIEIMIIASDGYTEAQDILEISFDLVPFTYVITMIMIIGGPLVGVCGILKYRVQFYNILYKKQFTYSDEQLLTGQEFKKQIPIILDLHIVSEKLLKQLQLKFKKEGIKFINQYFKHNKYQINEEMLLQHIDQIIQSDPLNPLNQPCQMKSQIIKNSVQEKHKVIIYQQQKEKVIDEEKQIENNQSKIKTNKSKELLNLKVDLRKDNMKLMMVILSKIYKMKLQQDKIQQKFYNKLKELSIKQGVYKLTDWYKTYTKITPLVYQQNKKHLLPKVFFNEEVLSDQFFHIYNSIFPKQQIKSQQLEKFNEIEVNPFDDIINKKNYHLIFDEIFPLINVSLIIHNLYGDALGLNDNKFLIFSSGESINCYPTQVYQSQAYQKIQNESKCLTRILSWINLDYVQKELSNNSRLPKWLTCKSDEFGNIYFYGTPQEIDIGEFLIRIEQSDSTIMRQFRLVIKKTEGKSLANLIQIKKKIINFRKIRNEEKKRTQLLIQQMQSEKEINDDEKQKYHTETKINQIKSQQQLDNLTYQQTQQQDQQYQQQQQLELNKINDQQGNIPQEDNKRKITTARQIDVDLILFDDLSSSRSIK